MNRLFRQAQGWRSTGVTRASTTAFDLISGSHAPPDDPSTARARAADEEGDAGMLGPRRTSAIACLLAALVLVVLDAAIANVALPAIARSLQATPAESVGVITAYQMALVMALLPPVGPLGLCRAITEFAEEGLRQPGRAGCRL